MVHNYGLIQQLSVLIHYQSYISHQKFEQVGSSRGLAPLPLPPVFGQTITQYPPTSAPTNNCFEIYVMCIFIIHYLSGPLPYMTDAI